MQRTDCGTISDGINLAEGGTLDSQIRVDLDSFLMYLIRKQSRHTLREWIHSDPSRPEHEVRRDLVFNRVTLWGLDRIYDMI